MQPFSNFSAMKMSALQVVCISDVLSYVLFEIQVSVFTFDRNVISPLIWLRHPIHTVLRSQRALSQRWLEYVGMVNLIGIISCCPTNVGLFCIKENSLSSIWCFKLRWCEEGAVCDGTMNKWEWRWRGMKRQPVPYSNAMWGGGFFTLQLRKKCDGCF